MKTSLMRSAAVVLFVLGGQAALADDDRQLQDVDAMKSADDLANVLFPPEVAGPLRACLSNGEKGNGCGPVIPSRPGIRTSLVTFERGSSKLSAQGREFLDRLAAALSKNRDLLASLTIEGHTDATGGRTINKKISKDRADAVSAYLKTKFNISNVSAVGKGSDSLKDPENPNSGVNRRIEFVVALPGQKADGSN